MAKGMKCDNCGKGIMYGQSHRHRKGVAGSQWIRRAQRTRKIFKPNLHTARIKVGSVIKKMRLCTKCLRQLKSEGSKLKTENQTSKVSGLSDKDVSAVTSASSAASVGTTGLI